jgi:hypothetical protein
MNDPGNPAEVQDNALLAEPEHSKNHGLEFVVFLCIGVLVYILLGDLLFPFNVIFFLAIQQLYLVKRGRKSFVSLFALSVFAIVIATVFISPQITSFIADKADASALVPIWKKFPQVSMVTNLALAICGLGFLFINLYDRKGMRLIYKLLIVTVLSSAVGICVFAYLSGDTKLTKDYVIYANKMLEPLKTVLKTDLAVIPESVIVSAFRMFLFALFSSINFTILALGWWLGMAGARRYFKINVGQPEIVRFRVPDTFIWPVIILLGCILLGIAFNSEAIGIIAINLLIIGASVFGVQGLGIVRYFIARSPALTLGFRYLPFIVLVLLFTASFVFPIFAIFVSGLGISEIWIRYRDKAQRKIDSE